jgi:hypothetical protein
MDLAMVCCVGFDAYIPRNGSCVRTHIINMLRSTGNRGITQNQSKEELEDVYKVGLGRCALSICHYNCVAACFQGCDYLLTITNDNIRSCYA